MPEPLFVLVQFVLFFIEVLKYAMLIRALMNWFVEGGNRLTSFLFVLTEPVVLPIRKLFHKMNWFQDTPIDMAFTFGMLALMMVELLLTVMI